MKKIVLFILMAVLIGCTKQQNPFLRQAKDLIDIKPDSAKAILAQVNLDSLLESGKIEYELLKTMAEYKTHSNFEKMLMTSN